MFSSDATVATTTTTTTTASTGGIDRTSSPVNIFIHTWFDRSSIPLALDILDEILSEITSSTSLRLCCDIQVYICIGATNVTNRQRLYINHVIGIHDLAVQVVDVSHLGIYEWATLQYLENFAADPSRQDSYILYMHTKGTTHSKFQLDRYIIAAWRKYLLHFLVKNADVCLTAMKDYGHHTCGVDKTVSDVIYDDSSEPMNMSMTCYAGNYWWTSTTWLKTRRNVFRKVVDDTVLDTTSQTVVSVAGNAGEGPDHGGRDTKGMAEAYLLWGVTRDESTQSHYCPFHMQHNG